MGSPLLTFGKGPKERKAPHTKKIGFSVKKMQGGYIMQNGKYVKEESLHLIITGITQEQELNIADRIKQSFNQECVIVTKELVETFII